MKHLLVTVAFLLALPVLGQNPPPENPTLKKEEKPSRVQYEAALKEMAKASARQTDPDFWKGAKFKNKKTGKVVAFPDLSDFERESFFFMAGERLTNEMKKLDLVWAEEEKAADKESAVSREDIQKYRERLLEIRKKNAQRFENYAEKFLGDHKDRFSDEKRDEMINSIRRWHDKENLIERK